MTATAIPDAEDTVCRCVSTAKGDDTWGCPRHDVEPADPDPAYLPAGRRED